jgi:hypothetical protein
MFNHVAIIAGSCEGGTQADPTSSRIVEPGRMDTTIASVRPSPPIWMYAVGCYAPATASPNVRGYRYGRISTGEGISGVRLAVSLKAQLCAWMDGRSAAVHP